MKFEDLDKEMQVTVLVSGILAMGMDIEKTRKKNTPNIAFEFMNQLGLDNYDALERFLPGDEHNTTAFTKFMSARGFSTGEAKTKLVTMEA